MSDSYEDWQERNINRMTTDQINEAIAIRHICDEPNVAAMQADLLKAEAEIRYWRDATEHMYHVKGNCTCQGRAEKLWCRRCWILTKFEQQTGEKMK